MKIVVLGATGHLGGYTARTLCSLGHKVYAVGRRESDHGFFKSLGADYIGNFCLENPNDYKRLPQYGIDAVVHLAGTMPAHSDLTPMPYIQSIIVGMIHVCNWMIESKIKRIVFNTTPSDFCHHFKNPRPVPEDAQRSFPSDGGDHAVYAISKNTAVDLLSYYQTAFDIQPCIFRHLTVYGWHPNPYYYINGIKKILPYRQIIRRCMHSEDVEIWGNPKIQKELLYIKDFASAVLAALTNNTVCGLFNLPGKRAYTLEEQIDGLIQAYSPPAHQSKKVYCPEKKSTPQNLLLIGGASKRLNWAPEWGWENACQDMRQEQKENPLALLWGNAEPEDLLDE